MANVQRFKPNDEKELKLYESVRPILDLIGSDLDEFYAGCYNASDFILALYDNQRAPFATRIPRAAFVDFLRLALSNFPFIGTFESYIFILRSVFGENSSILFEQGVPGAINIKVSAGNDINHELMAREFDGEQYETFNIATDDGYDLIARGIPGIESQYELDQLFQEIVPTGILVTTELGFFEISFFVAEEDSELFDVVDHVGNQIVFFETGE